MEYLSYKEAMEYTNKSKWTLQNLQRKALKSGVSEYNGISIFKKGEIERGHQKTLILKSYLEDVFNLTPPPSHQPSHPSSQQLDSDYMDDYIDTLKQQLSELNKANSELRKLLAMEKAQNQILLRANIDKTPEEEMKDYFDEFERKKQTARIVTKNEKTSNKSLNPTGKKNSTSPVGNTDYEKEYIKKETPKRNEVLGNLKNGNKTKSEQFLSFLKNHPMH